LSSFLGATQALADSASDTLATARASRFVKFQAPAGDRPATRDTTVDGVQGSILPNGRFLTPAGIEIDIQAPKPFGLALSPDGETLATINSGAAPFSISLVRDLKATPRVTRIDVNATFMGIAFAPDGQRFFASGGENGNVWVGDVTQAKIVASVNLNGQAHPLSFPDGVTKNPSPRFKGAFPGNLVLSPDGNYLYAVDQGGFKVHVIDTTQITTGLDETGLNNFDAVVASVKVGRYPYGIDLDPHSKTLFVSHVGVFEYQHLRPQNPTGDNDQDYPLCYPGAGYPEETAHDRTITIKKVDPRDLPSSLRDRDGIRCGYVAGDMDYKVPGLGSPNAAESSSVYALDITTPATPRVKKIVKTGLAVGEREAGIKTYAGSHPNSVAVGSSAIYVANGNNDSISVLQPGTYRELSRVSLTVLHGIDRRLKGTMPVAVRLSPDRQFLYVAEAGINAVAVIALHGHAGRLLGHIPVGWWPSSIQVSADGKMLYVANARGRGAGPNIKDESTSPKFTTMGSVSLVPVPGHAQLRQYTDRVLANNGFVETEIAGRGDPIPKEAGRPSAQIKHVIFINKENATHDLLLGDITETRKGVPVNGEPTYSLGRDASPNHHKLALRFTLGDNFYLEPTVSSDGHRWLANNYPTEFEDTHWPASYGGQRRDAGDDPEVIANYPGRIGFTDANSSPEPNDLNQHGGIYLHLHRNGKRFINFGNGFEFAIIDEPFGADPTGAREHVNVPMEKVVRDNSDHLFPTYNTHIPDAPLPEDPTRFSRYGRFKQVFETHYVDRAKGKCKLPDYVDLYYPNDHGGGANDINPNGPAWDFKRFVQDNDAALGLTVDLVSNSPCWKDTVIFVVEDDTQNGADHVDGHRSVFLAISPWIKREHVTKKHLSLASIFKTVNLILGLPPLNQYDAAATDLRDIFTSRPNFKPYKAVEVAFVAQANPLWLALTKDVDFSRPDADEVKLRNAILKSEGLPRRRN